MFSTQDIYNTEHHGLHYKQTHMCANSGNILNFRRTIWIEAAKLIECFDWKSRGNNQDREQECSKSIVLNIWSLLMSDFLLEGKHSYDYASQIEKSIVHAYEDNEFSDMGIYTLVESFTSIVLSSKESLVYNFGYLVFFSICKRLDISFDDIYKSYTSQISMDAINNTDSESSCASDNKI